MRTTLIITGLVAALALAACGDGAGTAADAGPSANRDAFLAFAKCMRAKGIDFPDPQAGEDGFMRMAPGAGDSSEAQVPPAKLRKADEACRHHLAGVKPPEVPEADRAEFEKAALEHAKCMRREGIDFPDPTFGENGSTSVDLGKGGLDPRDPKFRRAEQACRKVAPKGPAMRRSGP